MGQHSGEGGFRYYCHLLFFPFVWEVLSVIVSCTKRIIWVGVESSDFFFHGYSHGEEVCCPLARLEK
jgi:hypothetical protein